MKFNIFIVFLFLLLSQAYADVIYEKLDEKDFFDRPLVKISITGEIKIGDYNDLKKYSHAVHVFVPIEGSKFLKHFLIKIDI